MTTRSQGLQLFMTTRSQGSILRSPTRACSFACQVHVHFAACKLHATCGRLVIRSPAVLGQLTVNSVNYSCEEWLAKKRAKNHTVLFLHHPFSSVSAQCAACRMSYRLKLVVRLLTDSCCPGSSSVVEGNDKRTFTNISMPNTHFQVAQSARILTSTQLAVIAITRHE